MKFIRHKKIIKILISVFLIFSSRIVFAVWDGLPYNPGETINPECLPSQTDCDVLPSITTESDPSFLDWLISPVFTSSATTRSIIPETNDTYTLGSLDKVWKDLFVGAGSIYVNGQKVLQTDPNNSVIVSADDTQNLIFQTTGGANIELNPASGGGNILLKSNVTLTAGKTIRTSDLSAINFSDGINAGNIKVSGNIISSTDTNGGISITPNGLGNTYVTNGNFGVGTTSGLSKLSVNGGLHVGGDSDAGDNNILADGTITAIGNISGANLSGTNTGDNAVNSLYSGLATSKQDTLVSGTNIKTINGNTVLGSGDMSIGTFNLPALTTGSVLFSDGSTIAQDNANLFWDDANNRLGIGTTTPEYRLQISDGANAFLSVDSTTSRVKVGKSSVTAPTKTLDVAGNMNFNAVVAPTLAQVTSIGVADGGAGSIPAGTYYYGVEFYTSDGDTGATYSAASSPTITLSGPSRVNLTNIPTSTDPRVIGRKIYRSQAGTVGDYYFRYKIATIADNTTTTYQDNTTTYDSSDWEYNKQNTTAGLIYYNTGNGVLTKMMQLTSYVTAAGSNALGNLTRGTTTTAFGSGALANVTTGDSNMAFGHSAGFNVTTGVANDYFGYASGLGNQTGTGNSAFGDSSLRNNTNASFSGNSAFGDASLYALASGNNYNVGVGYYAGNGAQATGGVYLGYQAGYQSGGVGTVGGYNIVLGANSGTLLGAGLRNVLIGYDVELATPATSDQLNIGNIIYGTGLGTGSTPSATGKVGIGTSTPGQLLHVKDTTSVATPMVMLEGYNHVLGLKGQTPYAEYFNPSGTRLGWFGYGINANDLYFSNDVAGKPIYFATDGYTNPRMTILGTSGNVGIGTITPGEKLEVSGSSIGGIVKTIIRNTDLTDSASGAGIVLIPTTAGWGPALYATRGGSGALYFGTTSAAGGSAFDSDKVRMVISNMGNVGIGTTSPVSNLQVSQSTTGVGTVSNSAGGTTVTGVGTQFLNTFKVGDTITINGETVTISAIASNTSMTTGAITNANSAVAYTLVGGDRFSVKGNGNVGIGTSTPSSPLEISYASTGASGSTGLAINASSGNDSIVGLNVAGTLRGKFRADGNGHFVISSTGTGDIYFRDDDTTTNMIILDSGNVGIGTTSPQSQLDIRGGTSSFGTLLLSRTHPTVMGTDFRLGSVKFGGEDVDSAFSNWNTASINAEIDSTWTSATDTPTRLTFLTTPDASGTPLERMRIDNAGNVGIGTTAPTYKLDVKGTSATGSIRSDIGFDIYPVPDPTSPTGVVSAGGSVDDGAHWYGVTYVTAIGETHVRYSAAQITTTTGNNTVTLTIPTSADQRVTSRKIYRTKAGAQQYYEYYLATVNDNTTTTYVDTAADSSLTGSAGIVYFKPNTTTKNITLAGAKAFTIDSNATWIGLNAGSNITTGGRNTLVGVGAGAAITTGSDNQVFGHSAAGNITSGGSNVVMGYGALYSTNSGGNNTAIGHDSLFYNQTGSGNTAIGSFSLFGTGGVNSHNYNTAVGSYSLNATTTGGSNSSLGYYSIRGNTTGTHNSSLGYFAGRYIADGVTENTTGDYNVFIGSNTKPLADDDQNEIVMGYNTTGNGSNTATIGNSSIVRTYLTGVNLKAGTATAGTAPLKFTSGALLTAPEAGSVEFLNDAFYGTITTGAERKQFAFTSDLAGYVPYTGGTSNVDIGAHNLIVDTSTLFADATNHRVGIGTNSPFATLDVPIGTTSMFGYIDSPFVSLGEYQNFLLYTETFSDATWVKTDIGTVTADSATDPRGTTTAENIPAGSSATANVSQTITNSTTGSWTFSVYAKTQSGTGTIKLKIDSDTETGTELTVNVGPTWKKYSVTQNLASAHTTKTVKVISGTTAIALWASQLEPTTFARPYSGGRTTTALTALTRTTLIPSALSISGAVTGVSTLTMAGAFTGATTGTFSSNLSVGGNLDIGTTLTAGRLAMGSVIIGADPSISQNSSLYIAGGVSAFANPSGSTVFADDFTEAVTTTLASHTPVGTGTSWTMLIQNGTATLRAQNTGKVDVTATLADMGVLYTADGTYTSADYEVKVTASVIDTSDDVAIIAARIQDANNMYLFKFSGTAANNVLYKRVAGTWTVLGTSTIGVTAGSIVKLRVTGSTITAYRGDTLMISASDSSITNAGKAGLGAGNITVSTDDPDTTWDLDDFTVTNYETSLNSAIFATGNVGIGNTNPGYALHIGSASVTDATTLLRLQDADSTCDFNANTGAPTCGSDLTLKKNIINQVDNLNKVLSLRPVTYNWLTDADGVNIKHGFIAQEVEEIMPELVTESKWIDGSTKKFLQTAGMTPYIVGAIKEMNLKIEGINNFELDEEGNEIKNSWRDSLSAWFANAENRITRIFTGEICITEPGQDPVCLNRTELQSLKSLINASSSTTIINTNNTNIDTTTDTNVDNTTDEDTDTNTNIDTGVNTNTDTDTSINIDTSTDTTDNTNADTVTETDTNVENTDTDTSVENTPIVEGQTESSEESEVTNNTDQTSL
ncbi:MAG TPA: tail fiber domain-containing protein [Candidatus Paceibacterota bacterium]|nr:tail fiber domain-containing protein [Candidatus Paceibacterota bacterium]